MVRWEGTLNPAPAIATGSGPVTAAEDELAKAKKTLADKLIADPAADVKTEKKAVENAQKKVDGEKKEMVDAVSDGQHLKASDFLPAMAR